MICHSPLFPGVLHIPFLLFGVIWTAFLALGREKGGESGNKEKLCFWSGTFGIFHDWTGKGLRVPGFTLVTGGHLGPFRIMIASGQNVFSLEG